MQMEQTMEMQAEEAVMTPPATSENAPEAIEAATAQPGETAPSVPEASQTYPVPDDETLLALCEGLRGQFPRLDGEALIASDAFRAFGERVGWDSRAVAAGLPSLIGDAQALMQAAQPPVSRVTGTAMSHRRPLLSPHQQRELAEWNQANPQYKMSELDYFSALKNG